MPRKPAIFGLTILVAVCLCIVVFGQQQDGSVVKDLGWDITYDSLLKTNGVGSSEFVAKWLKETDRSFTRRLLGRGPSEKITASILIEHPAFHAGEHSVFWRVRTEDKAFFWTTVDKGENNSEMRQLEGTLFDDVFKSISSWKQLKPSEPNGAKTEELSGFFGFLSLYGETGSRQMLLTVEDFVLQREGGKSGRLQTALERITKR